MEYFFQNLKNNIDFFLRRKARFSKKNYFVENEEKEGLFLTEQSAQREQTLFEKYNLSELKSNSTRHNYLENLYTIDVLDNALALDSQVDLSVLDVGCKNWFYAKGEYFFFKKYCQKLKLDGIELDVNRLYSNFYTRAEVAKFYMKNLPAATYISGDFLELNNKYDYLIWILPFVVEYPLIKWGLPQKYFKPEKMLEHAFVSLNSGGKILIINQGEVEYEAQQTLCKKLNIPFTPLGEITSEFLSYKIPRYGIVIHKNHA